MRIKIAPSLLSADFSCLAAEVRKVADAGADMLHIDIMDGHFVPNLTIGPGVVKDLKKHTRLPLDVHLMIERPQDFIASFIKAGSGMITVHIETVSLPELKRIKACLRAHRIKLGISLNPATPFGKIKPALKIVDFVLVMSVRPGFGGQAFISSVLPKIRKIRNYFSGDIAVDGGINDKTGRLVIAAGANVLAAGSYIFKADNYQEAIRRLRQCKG